MDNLKNHIGEEVTITVSKSSGTETITGELKEVQDYIGITAGSWGLPFIGKDVAISKIVTNSGETIFENPYIGETYTYEDEQKSEEIFKKVFGEDAIKASSVDVENWEGYDVEEDQVKDFLENSGKSKTM